MKVQHIVIVAALLTLATGFKPDGLTQDIKEAKVKIDLPNENWFLKEKIEQKERVFYMFKRNPITDEQERMIIPNISVIVESVDKNIDVITYSAQKRISMPFDVDKMFIKSSGTGELEFDNAVGYKGTYESQGLGHTIYIIHALNKGKGIQVICDVTTSIFEQVDEEFLKAIKSLRN